MDLVELPEAPMVRRHPWETARFAFFRGVLRSAGALPAGARVLDVGAGDAWFADGLASEPERPSVVAWDVAYAGGAVPAARAVRLVDREPAEPFDLVLLLDVLEHVDDDAGFLVRIVERNVAAGGRVLVSVPAWPSLFGAHDARLGHRRRYRPRAARTLLEGAGLDPLLSGGLFHSLLAPRLLLNALHRRSGKAPAAAGGWNGSAAATAALRAALSLDAALSLWLARRGVDLPGLSWWALCRRAR